MKRKGVIVTDGKAMVPPLEGRFEVDGVAYVLSPEVVKFIERMERLGLCPYL